MLKKIFDEQYKLNERIIPDFKNKKFDTQWILKFAIALNQELSEFIDCFNWKWWTKKEENIKNAKIELIDMLHFWVSLCQLVGMNAEEVFNIYLMKNELNHTRQDKGYKTNEQAKFINGKEDNETILNEKEGI